MNQAMQKAKETFAQGNYTCVWCRDDELLTSKEAGLRTHPGGEGFERILRGG